MRTIACLIIAALAPSHALAAPPGYFIDRAQASASRPASLEKADGDFTMSIRREWRDDTGERLLGIAEATYPPRGVLVDLALQNAAEMGPDSAGALLWWYDGVGIARVPYAITLAAVDHYTRMTDAFRRHSFWAAGGNVPLWTDLRYKATVAHKTDVTLGGESYPSVYVAEMWLDWSYDDGVFRPVTRAHRIVVMTPRGKVLRVEGDGGAEEDVSMSKRRGIGKETRRSR